VAKDCEFKNVTAAQNQKDLVREAFIDGIASTSVRQLDLRTAINLADSLGMAQKRSASHSSCTLPATISATHDSSKSDDRTVTPSVLEKGRRKNNDHAPLAGDAWNRTQTNNPNRDSIWKECRIKRHYSRVCRNSRSSSRHSWPSEPDFPSHSLISNICDNIFSGESCISYFVYCL